MLRCLLRAALAALALPLALAVPVAPLAAQVGATTDIVTGKVTTADGRPVANAQVAVQSVETQVTRNRTTNDRGQYTVVFPDGGGQYRVTVRAIGFQPVTIAVTRNADEDRLEGDVVLRPAQTTQQLAGVTIRATPPRQQGVERPAPGTSERVLSGDQLNRLPVDGSDPAALAALSSGVVTTGADTSGSNAAGFSVAGQRPDLNQVTLDGLTFGGGVPQEAVRTTRVVTNTYDVARGQFTGGQVATTTRAGTNVVQGSLGYDLREPNLQFADDESAAYGQRYTQHQLSGGLGGPLVRDKLFLFGSFQLRHRAEGLQSLLDADREILGRLGTSYDSVRRFLGVLGASGVPAAATGAPDERLADNLTTIARLDWNVTERQTLTLRGDWRFGEQGGTRISPLGVPHAGGDLASLGGGAMLTLTSQWDNGMINELRAYGSLDQRDTDPYIQLPGGRVRVRSVLPDGVTSTTSLEFGGNAGLPQSVDNSQLELTDELSWISPGGAHRLKIGGLLNATAFDQSTASNQYGTFVFDSIAALERGIASSFTRTLSPTNRDGASVNQALYLGDTWRATRALQLVIGGRLEGTQYTGAPRYNAAVDTAFGLRTDRFPSEVHVSPRVGFTWTLGMPAQGQGGAGGGGTPGAPGGRGRAPGGGGGGGAAGARPGGGPQGPFGAAPALILRGGIGEFRGRVPSGLFTSAVSATGLPGTETQLVCVGDAVPAIDWAGWLDDPSTIPATCADGTGGGSTFGSRAPNVAAFAEDFAAPRSWRGSLGAQRRLVGRYFLNVEAAHARGVGLYGVTDRNLVDAPSFTLADEGGRPVYVPGTAIVDSTGQINSLASRRDRRFAGVYEVASGLRSSTTQVTVGINGFTGRGLLVSTSYTWSRSRDESSFSCCSAQQAFGSPTTAGDPNVREWSTSDYERRHVVVTTATMPVHPSLEVTGVVRLTSGQPYTPRVAGDLNGDGVRNDRAFVYDPGAAPDTALANGMQRLLRSAPGDVRDCLESQLGRIAGRNSCRGAWFPTVDLRMNYRPDRLGLKRNLMLSFLFVNPLAGLDQLLHDDDHLRGWGQPTRVDQNLLYVRGFDRDANRFRYEVNERFGAQRGARNAYRQPFQLAFQARYTVGPDRQRQMLQAAQAAARGQGTGLGAGNAGALARMAPNPFGQILGLPDSLGLALTPDQVARLAALRDTLAAKNQQLAERVEAQIQRAGNNADPAAMLALVREPLEEARANFERAIETARTVLTPEQWAKVPASVKTPQLMGPRGQQQRENRQERRRDP